MLGVLAGRVTAVAALAALIAALLAAPAHAASPPAPAPRAHAPAARTHPAKGTLSLTVPDAFLVGRQLVTVPGRVVHVTGVVRPYLPGQKVLVKAFVDGKQFKTDHLAV